MERPAARPLRSPGCKSPVTVDLDYLISWFIIRGGMIAPIAGGALLMIDSSFPVYASIVVFTLSGFCVLLLKETPSAGASKSGRAIIH